MRVTVAMVLLWGCEVPARDPVPAQPGEPARSADLPGSPGVDCALVAQALTSLELGNYAEPEERAPREREIRTLCTTTRLSPAEAQCLIDAPSKTELAWCARPLIVKHVARPPAPPTPVTPTFTVPKGPFAADICDQYVRTMERIARCPKIPAATQQQIRDQIPMLRQMYSQHGAAGGEQMKQSCQMANDATNQAMAQIGC